MMSHSCSTNHYEGHKEFNIPVGYSVAGGEYDIIDEVIGMEKH